MFFSLSSRVTGSRCDLVFQIEVLEEVLLYCVNGRFERRSLVEWHVGFDKENTKQEAAWLDGVGYRLHIGVARVKRDGTEAGVFPYHIE